MGAVSGAAARHAVDLEILIPPLARSDAVNLTQVVDHFGMRRVNGELAVPGRERLAVRTVQEPRFVRQIEVGAAGAEGRGPEPRPEAKRTDVVGQPLHAVWKLARIGRQAEVVKVADRQRVGVVLPRLNVPEFHAERLQVLLADARLGQIVLGRGFVEIDVPGHPAGGRRRTARAVDGLVIGHIAVAVVVALNREAPDRFGRLVDRCVQREPVTPAPLGGEPPRGPAAQQQAAVAFRIEERIVESRVRPAGSQLEHARALERLRAAGETVRREQDTAGHAQLAGIALRRTVVRQQRESVALALKRQVALNVAAGIKQREAVRHRVARRDHTPILTAGRKGQRAADPRLARRVHQFETRVRFLKSHLPVAQCQTDQCRSQSPHANLLIAFVPMCDDNTDSIAGRP